jgi:hypothetical protein
MSHRLLLGIGVYLLVFTYSSLTNYFDTDDMMNLYGAWHNFAGQVRPAGALFYRVVFEAAGFTPVAFHAAAYALILGNLILLARLLKHLTPSPAAALFFGCYQGSMWMIYASTGMIYDVLCATFLYAALLTAIEKPNWWPLIAALHIGAVSAKELGVTLPAMLILYSLYHQRVPNKTILATASISIFYVAQRLLIPGPLTGHAAYTPELSITRLLENITAYTNILFSHAFHFTALSAVLLWLGLFCLAGALRSRPMAFGLLFFWIAMSPMLLATPRHAGYVFYMPFIGLSIAVGAVYNVTLRKFRIPKAVVFAILVVALHHWQTKVTFKRGETPAGHEAIRRLAQIKLPLKQGESVLLLNSPGLGYDWLGIFTLSLTHRVRDLTVHEPPQTPKPLPPYDHILLYDSTRNSYSTFSPTSTRRFNSTGGGRSPYRAMTVRGCEKIQICKSRMSKGGTKTSRRPVPTRPGACDAAAFEPVLGQFG